MRLAPPRLEHPEAPLTPRLLTISSISSTFSLACRELQEIPSRRRCGGFFVFGYLDYAPLHCDAPSELAVARRVPGRRLGKRLVSSQRTEQTETYRAGSRLGLSPVSATANSPSVSKHNYKSSNSDLPRDLAPRASLLSFSQPAQSRLRTSSPSQMHPPASGNRPANPLANLPLSSSAQ
jgi:hypothetical protein